MSDPRKKICVVFDIDETLIHFVPNKYRSLWDGMSSELKSRFRAVDSGKNVILLRPYIQELFDYFKSKPDEIRVGLWTYSEREYSEGIAQMLTRELGLPADFFMFTWGAEDMENDPRGLPKNLTQIYHEFPDFNTFNTFLVDDLYSNLKHEVNQKNCVLIQPFAPFGTSKVRVDIGVDKQTEISNDTAFRYLIDTCQKVLKDIKGCDRDDIDAGFTTEPVFANNRVKRMKLTEFMKNYAVQFVQMFTIGKPLESKDFIMVDRDSYSEYRKGGKVTQRRKNKSKKTRRRTK